MSGQTATSHKAGTVQSVFLLAGAIRRAFSARMASERWAVDAKLRPGCYSVLRAVSGADRPVSQREVSELIGIDPSDVVGLVDTLEAASFLERRRDPADRRRHALHLTPRGRRAVARFERVAAEAHDEVLSVLEPDERRQLEGLIAKVLEHQDGAG